MFSSEQKFAINGYNDDALGKVLSLALEISGEKIKAFYNDKRGLVFCSYNDHGSTLYPFEATIPVLIEQIRQYIEGLSNDEVESLAGPEPGIDGSVELGWEVFHPLWYGEYEIENYECSAVLAVRPCWIVFAK